MPSAAAELVIRSRQEVEEQTAALHQRLERAMRYRFVDGLSGARRTAQHGAFAHIMGLIHQRQQKLDDLTHRLLTGATFSARTNASGTGGCFRRDPALTNSRWYCPGCAGN